MIIILLRKEIEGENFFFPILPIQKAALKKFTGEKSITLKQIHALEDIGVECKVIEKKDVSKYSQFPNYFSI